MGGNVAHDVRRCAARAHSPPGQPGGLWHARRPPAQAPTRYAQWIDEIKQLHQGEKTLNTYDDASGVARRLMKTEPPPHARQG